MTHAQKIASNPDYSVYVSASAGSGKTKVLTDRVLRILLQGTPPGKIMCLTFTKAAAAEMANRIHKELMGWVAMPELALVKTLTDITSQVPDSETIERARRLFVEVLDAPDGLKIQTIHAFCQNLIRRFPLEAGIPPHFQVVEEQTALELLAEARMRLLTERDKHAHTVYHALESIAWRVHEGSFTELLQQVTNERERLEYLLSTYTPEEIIRRIYQELGVQPGDTEEKLVAAAYPPQALAVLRPLCARLHTGGKTDAKTAQQMQPFLEGAGAFNDYADAFITQEGEPRVRLVTKQLADIEPMLRCEQQKVLALVDQIKSLRVAFLSEQLFHISEAVLALYKKLKDERAFLDYNDLIIASNRLLHKPDIAPWILFKLDGGIDHLLVDEAQDTSPPQWQVIEALCGEFFSGSGAQEQNRTIFIVGDEKQSIFSFQGADPQVFNKMQEVFSARAGHANKGWQSVLLDRSFRSTEPVLRCVDAVFSDDTAKTAVTFQGRYMPHVSHRSQHAGLVELWPLVASDEKETPQPWSMPIERVEPQNPKKKLANQIAATIRRWLDEKRRIPARGRAVQPGDIMILVRRRDVLVDYLVHSLKKQGVPVAGVDRMVLTDHIAVMDLVALGNVLLLPEDSLNLAAVLKSPLIGLSEEELFILAHGRGDKSLWVSLKEHAMQGDGFARAYGYLSALMAQTDFLSPFEIYSHVLDARDGRKRLASRLSEEVNDPVDEFLSLALAYEKSHAPSLQGFLHWLQMGKVEIKRDLDQGDNQVRIMTVHGSKGLQAPIVFLPDTTATPGSHGHQIVWAGEDGAQVMLWAGTKANMNRRCLDISEQNKQALKQEYMRLLYVALTRAEDELYIAGYQPEKSVPDDCWYRIVERGMEKTAEKEEDKWVVRSGQATLVCNDNSPPEAVEVPIELPAFAFSSAPEEPVPAMPLAPSQFGEEMAGVSPLQGNAVLRGKLIHTMLQYLPELPQEERYRAAEQFLALRAGEFPALERIHMAQAVCALLDHPALSALFGPNSRAEAPLAGVVGDVVISGRIDRLVVTEREVIIVDYKTSRTPPASREEVPVAYVKQMQAYSSALQAIYPDKTIRCALIWTQDASWMWV